MEGNLLNLVNVINKNDWTERGIFGDKNIDSDCTCDI